MSDELGKTGNLIWAAFRADTLDASAQALVRELARCADTLDRLDGLAAGRRDSWVELVYDDMGSIQLSVDKVLDVRRNHQLTLKALFSEIRLAGIKPQSGSGLESQGEGPKDMLAALRKAKEDRERRSG